jgi:NifB/MoaA-like Fe-S oxidoreductase
LPRCWIEKRPYSRQLTNLDVTVQAIHNEKLGGTITTAGLLMGQDVFNQLQASGYGDLIVLPRVMFDHPDTITLDNISPQDMANRLQRPVALADTLGDVWDALTGQSKVLYQPGVAPTTAPISSPSLTKKT